MATETFAALAAAKRAGWGEHPTMPDMLQRPADGEDERLPVCVDGKLYTVTLRPHRLNIQVFLQCKDAATYFDLAWEIGRVRVHTAKALVRRWLAAKENPS